MTMRPMLDCKRCCEHSDSSFKGEPIIGCCFYCGVVREHYAREDGDLPAAKTRLGKDH